MISTNQSDVIHAINQSVEYLDSGHYAPCAQVLNQVMAHAPQYPQIGHNLGLLCERCGDLAAAEAVLRVQVAAHPEFADSVLLLAYLLMKTGQYHEGFSLYQTRITAKPGVVLKLKFPLWDGTPKPADSVLVHQEQGFGDVLLMIRFLPLIADRVKQVVFWCHPALEALFQALALPENILIRSRGDRTLRIDWQLPLMSVPALLPLDDTVIRKLPVFSVPETLQNPALIHWLQQGPRSRRIAFIWRGNTNQRYKSLSLSMLQPVFEQFSQTDWISLERTPSQEELAFMTRYHIRNAGSLLTDFRDTATILANVDQILTIDTAVANLAGLLNLPAIVLLPFCADWRYGRESDRTLWLPAVRLLRQAAPDNWQSIISRLPAELA